MNIMVVCSFLKARKCVQNHVLKLMSAEYKYLLLTRPYQKYGHLTLHGTTLVKLHFVQ